MDGHRWYWTGYWICFVLVFLGCWIYCIASYGLLFGLGLGWIPSGITAAVVSFLWPLLGVAVVILLLLLIYVFQD
jgi:hypothetical protein